MGERALHAECAHIGRLQYSILDEALRRCRIALRGCRPGTEERAVAATIKRMQREVLAEHGNEERKVRR